MIQQEKLMICTLRFYFGPSDTCREIHSDGEMQSNGSFRLQDRLITLFDSATRRQKHRKNREVRYGSKLLAQKARQHLLRSRFWSWSISWRSLRPSIQKGDPEGFVINPTNLSDVVPDFTGRYKCCFYNVFKAESLCKRTFG